MADTERHGRRITRWTACLALAVGLAVPGERARADSVDLIESVWRLVPHLGDRSTLLASRTGPALQDDGVALSVSFGRAGLEGWRVQASGRRLPVRARSVELIDFDPSPRRHRHGSRLRQVRSLGLETDLGETVEVRLDGNRYLMFGEDFDVLAIGFNLRLR